MPEAKIVRAGATKAFFVRMLTRDIDLADAILDLLDNCVDGIVRDLKGKGIDQNGNGKPFDGYWAKIVAKPDRFEIWDNCGGIPEEVATEYAFMLGRPDPSLDADIETVGMYGIGMKRAMFKMGKHSTVTSQPGKSGMYVVDIPPEWLEDDHNWNLSLTSSGESFRQNGTKIEIANLESAVSRQFDNNVSTFLADLEREISRHYALILKKGFSVILNKTPIEPVELSILCPKALGSSKSPSIEPYLFVGEFDGVQVDLAVGFYRPLSTEQQLESLLQKSTRWHAGWSVICNDRIVLYNDKSMKTGWGTRGVPGYHNQFISIAGAVTFRSTDSMKLPLNTTKRGIDAETDIYPIVLEYMKDGLKKFTSFTNHWKGQEELTADSFKGLKPYKANEVAAALFDSAKAKFSTIRRHRDRGTGHYYSPSLPKPEKKDRKRRVCFSAEQQEIDRVAEYYFEDQDVDRSEIGRRCFDESLARAREAIQ